jgi:hypothetical protein
MKKLAIAAGAISLATWPYMTAKAEQFNVTVTATVPENCGWAAGGVDVELDLTNFVDAEARVKENPRNANLGTMHCNRSALLSVKTAGGGLKNSPSASCSSGGNSNCVNYTVSATWDETTVTYTTNGTANGGLSSSPSAAGASNTVTITVTPKKPLGNVALVAGDFTDTVTVKVAPPL